MRPAVALTRTASANRRLAAELEASGFEALDWPANRLEPIEAGRDRVPGILRQSPLLVFVSPGVVDVLDRGWPGWPSWVRGKRLFSMGSGTSRALAERDLAAEQQADPPRAAGMLKVLAGISPVTTPIRILCGDHARPELETGLHAAGRDVNSLVIYQNLAPPDIEKPRLPLLAAVFGSPSGAARMLEANPWLLEVPAVALGPTTGGWLRATGRHPRVIETEEPGSDSVIDVLQRL